MPLNQAEINARREPSWLRSYNEEERARANKEEFETQAKEVAAKMLAMAFRELGHFDCDQDDIFEAVTDMITGADVFEAAVKLTEAE